MYQRGYFELDIQGSHFVPTSISIPYASTHSPCSLISSCIASGARSISPGHVTTPSFTNTSLKKSACFKGVKTPVKWLGRKRTFPATPSANRTDKVKWASDVTSITSQYIGQYLYYLRGSILCGTCFSWHKFQSINNSD